MKRAILIASSAALVCAGVSAWLGNTGHGFDLALGALVILLYLAGWALALSAGILSVVNAARLRYPGWAGLFAVVTLVAVGGSCTGLATLFGLGPLANHSGNLTTNYVNQMMALVYIPLAAPPLAAALSTLLVRAEKPKPAQPPTGGS